MQLTLSQATYNFLGYRYDSGKNRVIAMIFALFERKCKSFIKKLAAFLRRSVNSCEEESKQVGSVEKIVSYC